jgi:hypothetical protein
MPSISFNITQNDTLLSTNVSANTQLTMSVTNPIPYSSYFSLETIPNNDGFYTIDAPKNLSGSFILDSNTIGLVKDDYKMSAIIKPGVTDIVYTPAINIIGSTLRVRGISGTNENNTSTFDSNYQEVLNLATSLGFTLPSSSQQTLQNQLVLDLKTADIWDKLDIFGVFATNGDSNFALIDWKRRVNNQPATMSNINGTNFVTNQGFSGSSGTYIDTLTTLDSGSNFDTVNKTGSFGGWSYYTKSGGSMVLCGAQSTYNTIRGGTLDNIQDIVLASSQLSSGSYHMNINPTIATQYINGVSVANVNSPGVTVLDSSNFLALADFATPSTYTYSTDTISILFSGGDLSTEASTFYNILNTYISAL